MHRKEFKQHYSLFVAPKTASTVVMPPLPQSRALSLMAIVCLSVPWLTLTEGHKKHEGSPWHGWPVTRPMYRSKGQRSRSLGRLTPWPKISHIFGTGRHTIRTTSFVYWWTTMTRITDMCGYLQNESSGWLFKSPLVRAGHIILYYYIILYYITLHYITLHYIIYYTFLPFKDFR